MRINPQIPPVDTTATNGVTDSRSGAAKAAPSSAASQPSDTVQLSSNTATIRQLVNQAQQLPDVRQEKISALRAQVQSGQLQHSNEQIAGAIVSDLFGVTGA